MSAVGFDGVNVRAPGDRIIVRALLQDQTGNDVTAGTTTLSLFELQDDGSIRTFDFADNTFKATAVATATADLVYRPGNAGTLDLGLWTYVQTVLDGFTPGAIYLSRVSNIAAFPPAQMREFQYGGVEGDPATPVWSFAERTLTGDVSIDEDTIVAALESIIIATGLTARFTNTSGQPLAQLNLPQAIAVILAVSAGDRGGVGTRSITSGLPGDVTSVQANRIDKATIQSTVVVPD